MFFAAVHMKTREFDVGSLFQRGFNSGRKDFLFE